MAEAYELIRSQRKTVTLQLKPDGRVIVRAPLRMSEQRIRDFVAAHEGWLQKHRARMAEQSARLAELEPLTAEELRSLTERARAIIPLRVKYYAPLVGVRCGAVTIRHQHRRWGSCSSTGNLSFNCLLMLAPMEVLDSVVVHELCHRLEPNHSQRFYDQVLRVFPDYWNCHQWLKDHGPELLRRNPE